MELEINGKKFELVFGIAFLRKVNEKYVIDARAKEMGMNTGLDALAMYFQARDVEILIEIVKMANKDKENLITDEDLEIHFNNSKKGSADLYDQVIAEIKKSPVCGEGMKIASKNLEDNMKKQKA